MTDEQIKIINERLARVAELKDKINLCVRARNNFHRRIMDIDYNIDYVSFTQTELKTHLTNMLSTMIDRHISQYNQQIDAITIKDLYETRIPDVSEANQG